MLTFVLVAALSPPPTSPPPTRGFVRTQQHWTTVDDLHQLRSKCQWKRVAVHQQHGEYSGWMKAIAAAGLPQETMPLNQLQTCMVDVSGQDGAATLFLMRLGDGEGNPLQVQAGSWFNWNLDFGFPDSLAKDHTVRVVGLRGVPVYPNGSVVPLPPLHNHHAGMNRAREGGQDEKDTWLPSLEGFLAMGGADAYCDDANGGEECTFHSSPPGTAFEVPQESKVSILVNDVRPPDAATSAYPVFYELAFRIHMPSQDSAFTELRRALNLQLNQWGSDHFRAPSMRFKETNTINTTMYETFLVPPVATATAGDGGQLMVTQNEPVAASYDRVHFVQTQWVPCAGMIHNLHYHTHQHWAGKEALLFAGDLQGIMEAAGYGHADGAVAQILHHSVEYAVAQLLKQARHDGALRLLCRVIRSEERRPVIPGAPPTEWDRESMPVDGECINGPAPLHPNETLASICFPHANPGEHTDIHMHCAWGFYFVADDWKQCS